MPLNLTIIGAGPGGYTGAVRAAQRGATVTLIDREGVGGTCLNWGCIPTKALKAAADTAVAVHAGPEFGIEVPEGSRIAWRRVLDRTSEVVDSMTRGIRSLLSAHNVRLIQGRARLAGPRAVSVETRDGGAADIVHDRLILAPGSRPFSIAALPVDGERIITSNHALRLNELPRSLLIVGGGVIGCEFATLFRALGCDVTIVEALDRLLPLPGVDEECSTTLQREMKKQKIRFLLNRTVLQAAPTDDGVRVNVGPSPAADPSALGKKERVETTVEVEKVLVCVGRGPNTSGLGLRSAGVRLDDRGWIVANDRMETALPGVYAVGDALGPARIMLAHVASAESLVAVENCLGGESVMRYDAVPSVVFTRPEVASVGFTERQARARGLEVKSESVMLRTLGKAQADGSIAGHLKLIYRPESHRIVGVHITGHHASEMINLAAVAVSLGATVDQLASTIYAHPTMSEAFAEASSAACGVPLHLQRTL